MKHLKPAAVAVALLCSAPLGARADYRPERIGWSELHYEAHKLGFSIESSLTLRKIEAAELRSALIDPGPGSWRPAPADGGWRLDLATNGLGGRSELELLIDREGGALQRTQVETGRRPKDRRNRTYRFGTDTVFIRTLRPAAGELDRPPSEWTELSDWTQELPGDNDPGQSTGLFYTLGASDLNEPGDRLRTYVLSKGQVMEVDLVVEARELLTVDHVEEGELGARRRTEPLSTLRIRLDGKSVEKGGDESDFRFLGLRGDVYVYLDETSRAPVLITGRVGWLGRAKVRLTRLALRAN